MYSYCFLNIVLSNEGIIPTQNDSFPSHQPYETALAVGLANQKHAIGMVHFK